MSADAAAPGLGQVDPAALADLLAAVERLGAAGTAPRATLGQYADAQLAALRQAKPDKAKSLSPGLRLLARGAHGTCRCECPACQDAGGCPCPCGCAVDDDGAHRGMPADDARPVGHHPSCAGRPGACASRWTGRGTVPMGEVTVADIEQAQAWVRIRALKANRRMDRDRARKGKRQCGHDGRGAAAWLVTGARWLWARAIDDGIVTRDVTQRVRKPALHDTGVRSLSPERLDEAFRVAVDTSEDPDGDELLFLAFVQTAARRGGIVTATYGRLDVERATIVVSEPKRDGARHEVAITPDLARRLRLHALARGPRVPAPPGAPEEQRRAGIPALAATDPLLYRTPVDEFDEHGHFVHREARPITTSSVSNVRERIRKHLPWAEAFGLRWHDVRHTTGTMLDRIAGHSVAAYHLGHKTPADMTAIYTKASLAEDAAAIAILFGCEHPLAPPGTGRGQPGPG